MGGGAGRGACVRRRDVPVCVRGGGGRCLCEGGGRCLCEGGEVPV